MLDNALQQVTPERDPAARERIGVYRTETQRQDVAGGFAGKRVSATPLNRSGDADAARPRQNGVLN